MSGAGREAKPGRIALALAGTDTEARAIETMKALAGTDDVAVSCVVIEDTDLLRAAELPFAIEVCRATNVIRRIDAGDLRRTLQQRTASVMRLVQDSAKRAGAQWSFDVVRQRTATAVLELVQSQDVTLLCTADTFPSARARHAPRHDENGGPVVVVLDRSAASRRAFETAKKISQSRKLPLAAFIVAATPAGIEGIRERLLHARPEAELTTETLVRPDFDELAARIRGHHPAALVLPVSQVSGSPARIDALETGIDSPIVIVR